MSPIFASAFCIFAVDASVAPPGAGDGKPRASAFVLPLKTPPVKNQNSAELPKPL